MTEYHPWSWVAVAAAAPVIALAHVVMAGEAFGGIVDQPKEARQAAVVTFALSVLGITICMVAVS